MTNPLRLRTFPGALYGGDGTLLAGDGPEMSDEFAGELPHKALIRDTPGDVEVAVLEKGDRLWLLPDSFGMPPVLPMLLLTDLADLVRRGHKVGLAAHRRALPHGAVLGWAGGPGVSQHDGVDAS